MIYVEGETLLRKTVLLVHREHIEEQEHSLDVGALVFIGQFLQFHLLEFRLNSLLESLAELRFADIFTKTMQFVQIDGFQCKAQAKDVIQMTVVVAGSDEGKEAFRLFPVVLYFGSALFVRELAEFVFKIAESGASLACFGLCHQSEEEQNVVAHSLIFGVQKSPNVIFL